MQQGPVSWLATGLRRLPTFFRQWLGRAVVRRSQLRGSSGFSPLSRASCCFVPAVAVMSVIDEREQPVKDEPRTDHHVQLIH